MSSVDFTYIETYNEIIKPIGEIKVADNILNGARAVTYWSLAWGDMWGDASIKAADLTTYISAYDLSTNGVSAVLKDAEGNALTGETISYTSALGNGTVETDEYGNILIEKVYGFVDLFFEGNDNYLPCNLTVYVAPTTIDTFLQAADVVVDYASGQKLTATLLDVFGNPVSGLNVKITVGTLAKTLKTNANGQVSLDVSHLDPGNYTAQIKAATSAIYNRAEPITANVYVKPISHLVAESFVTGYNSGDLFVVSLLDEYGNAISGVNVKITVGTIAKTLKTDANGQVALDISGLDIGDYVATIKAATSEAYSRAAQITTDITITKGQSILIADDFTTAHNSGEKFVAILVNGKGEALSGVNVKITVGTIAKTLKTDANGQVALDVSTLEPGSYTAKIISANTDLYNKATPINSNVTITA
jgi:hypothetical protein